MLTLKLVNGVDFFHLTLHISLRFSIDSWLDDLLGARIGGGRIHRVLGSLLGLRWSRWLEWWLGPQRLGRAGGDGESRNALWCQEWESGIWSPRDRGMRRPSVQSYIRIRVITKGRNERYLPLRWSSSRYRILGSWNETGGSQSTSEVRLLPWRAVIWRQSIICVLVAYPQRILRLIRSHRLRPSTSKTLDLVDENYEETFLIFTEHFLDGCESPTHYLSTVTEVFAIHWVPI